MESGESLDGAFVEVAGVVGPVEALDANLQFLGEALEANGRQGWARLDADSGDYLLDTRDGVVLCLPPENLQRREAPRPEEGGVDAVWPTEVSMAKVGPSFALKVAEVLARQAFCVVEMPPQADTSVWFKVAREVPLAPLDDAFAEIYLGHTGHATSPMAWLAELQPPYDLDGEFMSQWYDRLAEVSAGLMPLCEPLFGFKAAPYHAGSLLRVAPQGRGGGGGSNVSEEDVVAGVVERHLDFQRRRRLCLMYFMRTIEEVYLWSKGGEGEGVRLPMRGDRLLIFRHDLLHLKYSPVNGSETVLQTWILEEAAVLELEGFQGSQRSLEALLGGPALAPERQVHVMNGICRFPGSAYRLERDWATYCKQTDTFIEIPIGRFDIDLYWEPAGQFNSTGKSSTKHAGLLHDMELICFDNEYFHMEKELATNIPPIQRVLLELVQELFSMVNFGLNEPFSNRKLYTVIADIGIEWDNFQGFHANPMAWLKSSPMQVLSINRLCHTFNLTGPAHQVDTACSASLVGCNMGHAYLRKCDNKEVKECLAMGLQHIISPFPFVGLSGAGMLGSGGRCKTFDQSANGYNRGEGCGGLFAKVSDDLDVIQERLACYCGSYVNQDGRSASLTAPNGPSQQMVIRGSLTQADIQTDWVAATENHGTGTALGDPIETGSIRAVFRKRSSQLVVTSGKTHMGHLEAGAGAVGLLKVICSLTHGAVPPNCHLRQPNAHCDFEGFPGLFPIENCSLPNEYHYVGANGFGFGGTNSRADFWALRRGNEVASSSRQAVLTNKIIGEGAKRRPIMPRLDQLNAITVQCGRCLQPMCWLCSEALPVGVSCERHRCRDVRVEAASYDICSDCYKGPYLCGGPESKVSTLGNGEPKVWLNSTAMGWSGVEMRQAHDDRDAFEVEMMLTETLLEQFHFTVQLGPRKQVVQPVSKCANQRVRVAAPVDKAVPGMNWLIDGRADGARQGTLYTIRLQFGEGLSVSWKVHSAPEMPYWSNPKRPLHQYFIVSSHTGWVPHLGSNDGGDRSLWRWFLGKIPAIGMVELVLVRDQDSSQMFYPAIHSPKDESVAVLGPDNGGDGKRWLVTGAEGEQIQVSLKVDDGEVIVNTTTNSMGKRTYLGSTARRYHIWKGQQLLPMEQDAALWRAMCQVGADGRGDFQIWVNENANLRIYPAGGGGPGNDLALGPDRRGAQKFWQVAGPPGSFFEVVLDLGAEDSRKIVTCAYLGELEGGPGKGQWLAWAVPSIDAGLSAP